MIFSKEDKQLLLELITNEQINMLIENLYRYESDKCKKLEELKNKINNNFSSNCTKNIENNKFDEYFARLYNNDLLKP